MHATQTDSKAVVSSTAALGPARFVVPKPGVDGPHGSLAGETVVLTGIFPEIGGGAGLKLGKEKTKAMVQSFGGRVRAPLALPCFVCALHRRNALFRWAPLLGF
jgi:hypothetical protein